MPLFLCRVRVRSHCLTLPVWFRLHVELVGRLRRCQARGVRLIHPSLHLQSSSFSCMRICISWVFLFVVHGISFLGASLSCWMYFALNLGLLSPCSDQKKQVALPLVSCVKFVFLGSSFYLRCWTSLGLLSPCIDRKKQVALPLVSCVEFVFLGASFYMYIRLVCQTLRVHICPCSYRA
jgi:hypothetical protein